jgi:hypothetical protein
MGKLVFLGEWLVYKNPCSYRCEAHHGSVRGYPYQINQSIKKFQLLSVVSWVRIQASITFLHAFKCQPKSREFETSIFPKQNDLKMKNPRGN